MRHRRFLDSLGARIAWGLMQAAESTAFDPPVLIDVLAMWAEDDRGHPPCFSDPDLIPCAVARLAHALRHSGSRSAVGTYTNQVVRLALEVVLTRWTFAELGELLAWLVRGGLVLES